MSAAALAKKPDDAIMAENQQIGIIDYGSGNFTSVWNAVRRIEEQDRIVRVVQPEHINDCSHLILPGVGAFDHAINCLQHLQLLQPIIEWTAGNRPFLGICVGMQIMAAVGYEFGTHKGIGIVDTEVVRFCPPDTRVKVPHIGWNSLKTHPQHALYDGLPADATFYFVHSYYMRICPDPQAKWAVAEYAGVDFAASVSIGNVHGVQFHPEKSQLYGLMLLKNFIRSGKPSPCSTPA